MDMPTVSNLSEFSTAELIIIRGLPGAGKTSLARQMVGYQHFEADQYFEAEGVYKFDRDRLPWAHTMCMQDTRSALSKSYQVVVSNTFTRLDDLDQYLMLKKDASVIECHGRYGNIHSVQDSILSDMASRWQSTLGMFDAIEVAQAPTAIDLWLEIARKNHEIAEYHLIEFEIAPPIQLRLPATASELAVISDAMRQNTELGVPFWDAMLTSSLKKGVLSDALLHTAARSYPSKFEPISLSREALLAGALRSRIADIAVGKSVAMLSAVKMSTGEIRHLPLFDLRCEPDAAGLYAAWQIGRRLMPTGGVVMNSGKSLHLVANQPVPLAQMIEMLIQSLFYCPIVDRNYVAHHLRHRVCSLRVSAKNGEPTVALVYGSK